MKNTKRIHDLALDQITDVELSAEEIKEIADINEKHEQQISNFVTARNAAIEHAKSLGFTDAMIAVMYPSLGA